MASLPVRCRFANHNPLVNWTDNLSHDDWTDDFFNDWTDDSLDNWPDDSLDDWTDDFLYDWTDDLSHDDWTYDFLSHDNRTNDLFLHDNGTNDAWSRYFASAKLTCDVQSCVDAFAY